MTRRGERGIWQRRYWEHMIRDDRDFAAHTDYTHFDLMKHGPVEHRRSGHTRRFARMLGMASIPPDGRAAAPSRKTPASGREIEPEDHTECIRRNAVSRAVLRLLSHRPEPG
jgi:hypothetical protein